MNIKQSLKRKNKIVSDIKKNYELCKKYNSYEKGLDIHFEINKLLKTNNELLEELLILKSKIHKANTPVHYKIFKLSELKSKIKYLNSIPTTEGTSSTSRYSGVTEIRNVQINAKDIHDMIQEIENEIELIQDELDIFNTNTEI